MSLSPELIASIDALGLSPPVRNSLLSIADEIRGAYEERIVMTEHVLTNTQRALEVAVKALKEIDQNCGETWGVIADAALARIEKELGK